MFRKFRKEWAEAQRLYERRVQDGSWERPAPAARTKSKEQQDAETVITSAAAAGGASVTTFGA